MDRAKILVLINESEGSRVAFDFACYQSKFHNSPIELINIVKTDASFNNPLIANARNDDKFQEAEKILQSYCEKAKNEFGIIPGIQAIYGEISNVVEGIIKNDSAISVIIIGHDNSSKGKNNTVNEIISKLSNSSFMIPITIIPDNLTKHQIKSIFGCLDEE